MTSSSTSLGWDSVEAPFWPATRSKVKLESFQTCVARTHVDGVAATRSHEGAIDAIAKRSPFIREVRSPSDGHVFIHDAGSRTGASVFMRVFVFFSEKPSNFTRT